MADENKGLTPEGDAFSQDPGPEESEKDQASGLEKPGKDQTSKPAGAAGEEAVMDDGVGQSVKKEKKDQKKGLLGKKNGQEQELDPETVKKNKMAARKKRKKLIMILIIILAAALALYFFLQYRKKKAAAASATSTENTATVTKQNLTKSISSTGTIKAKDTYSITALVSGTIISADFEEGDQVTKGQTLYQIDASSMDSELTSAQNTLTRAQSAYDDAVKDYNEAKDKYGSGVYKATQAGYVSKVYIADGQSVSNNTNLVDLVNDTSMKIRIPFLSGEAQTIGVGNDATLTISDTLEQVAGTVIAVAAQDETLTGGRIVRYVTIQAANPGGLTTSTTASAVIGAFSSVAEGTFESVSETTMAAMLDASVESDKVLVNLGDYVSVGTPIFSITGKTRDSLLKSYSDAVDTKKATLESAQEKLDSTTDTIDKYTITAPIAGQVITKTYKTGDKIGSSSSSTATTLATIYDMSAYTFSMSIDETDIGYVSVDQTVNVTADAVSGKTFTGKVTNISLESTVSNGVSTYPVTVTLDTTDDLLPGMNVDADIVVASASDALCVPADSIQRGNKVYVQDMTVTKAVGLVPAGFKAVQVTTGLITDDFVQITEGLTEGETVYVNASSTKTTTTTSMMGGPGGGGPGGGGMRSD